MPNLLTKKRNKNGIVSKQSNIAETGYKRQAFANACFHTCLDLFKHLLIAYL